LNDQELLDRFKKFALRCLRLAKALSEGKIEHYIQMQLVTLSTSCAINMRVAFLVEKKPENMIRLNRALEEIEGCCFWIECIIIEAIKKQEKVTPLLDEALELRDCLLRMVSNSGKKSPMKLTQD
jgi:hypothetical protein